MFYVIIVALIITVVAMILDNRPETKEKVVSWLKDTIKWVAICAFVVAAFFAMVYFSMPVKAEELQNQGYIENTVKEPTQYVVSEMRK